MMATQMRHLNSSKMCWIEGSGRGVAVAALLLAACTPGGNSRSSGGGSQGGQAGQDASMSGQPTADAARMDAPRMNPPAMDTGPSPIDMGGPKPPGPDAPVVMPSQDAADAAPVMAENPVPANAAQMRCAQYTTVQQFEQRFFSDPKRGCTAARCHAPPDEFGPRFDQAGIAAQLVDKLSSACSESNQKLIDLKEPRRSAFLWRLWSTTPKVPCPVPSMDEEIQGGRRMPLKPGTQCEGTDFNTPAARLPQADLECATWYVYQLAAAAMTRP
jgi:hypothetical protein